MQVLDLSAKERPSTQIILPNKFTVDVTTPTKALRDLFPVLGATLIKVAEHKATAEDNANLYEYTARILSRNKQATMISKADVEALCDMEDVMEILTAYMGFIKETEKAKN